MKMRCSSSRGFTLIEVMMVVAIIGLLASIAIPLYQDALLKVRQSERDQFMMPLVLEGLASVAATGLCPNGEDYMSTGSSRQTTLDGTREPFDPVYPERWAKLAASPKGALYGNYTFYCETRDGTNGAEDWVYSYVRMDLDGDGVESRKLELWSREPGRPWERDSSWSDADTWDTPPGVY